MSSHPQTKNAILEIASFPNNKKEEKASEEKVLKRTKIDFGDVPVKKKLLVADRLFNKEVNGL